MSAGKACLGYETRTEAVLALRANGLRANAIAARIGILPKQVASLEASARRVEKDRSRRDLPAQKASGSPIEELIPAHQRDLVRRHAAARDMSCTRLLQEIVDRVITDDLVDAVLDDGKGGRT